MNSEGILYKTKEAVVSNIPRVSAIIIISGLTTVFNFLIFAVRDTSTYSQRISALESFQLSIEGSVETINKLTLESVTDTKIIKNDVTEIKSDLRELRTELLRR